VRSGRSYAEKLKLTLIRKPAISDTEKLRDVLRLVPIWKRTELANIPTNDSFVVSVENSTVTVPRSLG